MKTIVGPLVAVAVLFVASCSSDEPVVTISETEQTSPAVETATIAADPASLIDGPVFYDCASGNSGVTNYVNLYWVNLETETAHSLRQFDTPLNSGLNLAGCSSGAGPGQASRLKFNEDYTLAAVELPRGAGSKGHIGVKDLVTGNYTDLTTFIDSGGNAFSSDSRHSDPSFDVDGNLVFWDQDDEVWLTYSMETRNVIKSTEGDISPAFYNLPQHAVVNTFFFWRIDDFNFLRQEVQGEGDEFAITKWTSPTPLPSTGEAVDIDGDANVIEGEVVSPYSENRFNSAAAKADGSEFVFTVSGQLFVANQANPEQPRAVDLQGFDLGYVMDWE